MLQGKCLGRTTTPTWRISSSASMLSAIGTRRSARQTAYQGRIGGVGQRQAAGLVNREPSHLRVFDQLAVVRSAEPRRDLVHMHAHRLGVIFEGYLEFAQQTPRRGDDPYLFVQFAKESPLPGPIQLAIPP